MQQEPGRATLEALQRSYSAAAAQLAERVAALPEAGMRTATLAAALAAMGAVQAVWTLEWLLRGALRKRVPCGVVCDSLIDPHALDSGVDAAHLDAMLQTGVAQGCVAAVQWLRSAAPSPDPPQQASEELIARALRELTLGQRRALARSARGDDLDRLAMDPDPMVICNLLANPRMTEARVLRICSRRPTVSAPLEAVLRSVRWRQRYRVRLALLKNPYLHVGYAVNLLVFLTARDLWAVCRDESLAPVLRLAAQRLAELGENDG